MTRKEEILKQVVKEQSKSQLFESIDWRAGFIEGAKWADKTMIDKTIKWIKENIDLVAMDTVSARSGYHEIVMMNDFEQKFREAMEK